VTAPRPRLGISAHDWFINSDTPQYRAASRRYPASGSPSIPARTRAASPPPGPGTPEPDTCTPIDPSSASPTRSEADDLRLNA
jgi:hypothetical protein